MLRPLVPLVALKPNVKFELDRFSRSGDMAIGVFVKFDDVIKSGRGLMKSSRYALRAPTHPRAKYQIWTQSVLPFRRYGHRRFSKK
jgi:hypothetical protein